MNNSVDDMLFRTFSTLSTQRTFTIAAAQANPPSWEQLKKLSKEAEKVLNRINQPLSPANLLLAMMAVITCQVSMVHANNYTYWAYLPNPPLLQAVAWGDLEVPVCINNTNLLPYPSCNGWETHHSWLHTPTVHNYTIASSNVPVCIGNDSMCLDFSHEVWALKHNYSTLASSMIVLTMKSFKQLEHIHNSTLKPPNLPLCTTPIISGPIQHIDWVRCRGHFPTMLVNNSEHRILDWSAHGTFQTKFAHYRLGWHKNNNTLDGSANETIVWREGGLAPPHPFYENTSIPQGQIWKILASAEPIHIWKGNMSLQHNTLQPFHIHLYNNKSIWIQACVRYPYMLVKGPWSWNRTLGRITCSECQLLQCTNITWWSSFNASVDKLLFTRLRTDLWLPVQLSRPWSDSAGLTALYHAVDVLLKRTRRMVGVILAVVLGLAAVTATAAVAGTALYHSVQIADFVKSWYQAAHSLWMQQQRVDSQMNIDIQNLQHTVKWLGDQITVLTTRSLLKCDWNSTTLCITSVPYNYTQQWDKIKNNLLGHQNITEEIIELQNAIAETFAKQLPDLNSKEILQSMADGIANMNPFTTVTNMFSHIIVNTSVIIIVVFILFLVIRRWFRDRVKQDNKQMLRELVNNLSLSK
ncbi:endogenous retrovirus group K member 6 Env polyprotein-like [Rhynchonycteris naso]